VSIERNIRINVSGGDTTGTANLLKLSNAVKVVAMGYAALRTAQKAVEFVKLGAQAQAAEQRLVSFAGGTERATEYLKALNAGADNTIDRMTGMAMASRLVEMGLVSTASEMEIMGAVASKLGDQSQSLEQRMGTLTMLLANQSTLRLDTFGMSTERVTKRQKELEKQGYATEKAFTMAVIEEGTSKLAELGDQSGSTATKLAQVDRVFKDIKISGAEAAASITAIYLSGQDLSSSGIEAWFENLGVQWRNLHDYGIALQVGVDILNSTFQSTGDPIMDIINMMDGGTRAAEGFRNALLQLAAAQIEWNHTSEISRYRQYDQSAATEEVIGTLIEEGNVMTSVSYVSEGYMRQLHNVVQSDEQLEATILGTIAALEAEGQAMRDTAAAALDLAMSYSAYYQQAGASATSYYGGLGDAEARYQERVKQIQGMGAGSLGGGGGATPGREFDRADIERGLRIQKAQLAEAEAKQEGWDMGEKLEGMSWEDISREDRKWLTEHGKTLEDLQAEHVKTGEDITELERAQMDDRIEDLKGEIEETERILKQGHYDQHVMRIAAAKVDTAALLAEAAIRRDEEIAILEGSRIQQEAINQQSLGRLELASFDSWAARNLDTETATAEELRQVELMRLDIALKYGLITADTLTNTTDQWAAWDTMFLNIETGADTAKTAVDNLINAIKSLPSRGDVYWGEILPPGTIQGKQSGGSVLGGRPYLVGEGGPELFMPRQAGYVYNAQQSKQITSARDSHDTYIVSSDRAWQQIDEERRARARAAFTESAGM